MLRIDVWSDIACPFCYIGKRGLEMALATFEHADEVEVHWRAFELDPRAPGSAGTGLDEMLAAKYGMPLSEAHAMNDRVARMAAGVGLTFDLAAAKPGNTFAAHRVVKFAGTEDLAAAAAEELFAGYFSRGADLTDPDALAACVAGLGLDRARVRAVAAGAEFAAEVRADEEAARSRGITGVPYFLVDSRYAISGAQPPELFERALSSAWNLLTGTADEPAGTQP
jgi:protein disulfide-isomerase